MALARRPAAGYEDCSIGPGSSAEIQRITLRQYGGAPRRRCRPHLRNVNASPPAACPCAAGRPGRRCSHASGSAMIAAATAPVAAVRNRRSSCSGRPRARHQLTLGSHPSRPCLMRRRASSLSIMDRQPYAFAQTANGLRNSANMNRLLRFIAKSVRCLDPSRVALLASDVGQ
jgi:hypothetical protein